MGTLDQYQQDFIAEWGALGPAWGMTRTVARVHALLMVADEPLTTDDIMERLAISRGGAHAALRELVGMGIAQSAVRKGERKETFVGEKDPWKVFCAVIRERKRREVEPILAVLEKCIEETQKLSGNDSKSFRAQLSKLYEFVSAGDRVMERIGNSEEKTILKWMLSLVGRKRP